MPHQPASSPIRVAVIGHTCVDLTPELPGPACVTPGTLVSAGALHFTLGGTVGNTGGDLLALGLNAQLFVEVGQDELGLAVQHLLHERDGDDHQVFVRPGASTSYSLVIQPPGADRTFWHHVGVNELVDGSRFDPAGFDLAHIGYPQVLPALTGHDGAPLEALLKRCHQAGVATSLDFCVLDRSGPLGDLDWAALLSRWLPWVDVISPSLDDLASTLDFEADATPERLQQEADTLVRQGCAIALVTGGPHGMALATAAASRFAASPLLSRLRPQWHGVRLYRAAPPVQVVTTVGAGDAATAGLLTALAHGATPDQAITLAAATASAIVGGAQRLHPQIDLYLKE